METKFYLLLAENFDQIFTRNSPWIMVEEKSSEDLLTNPPMTHKFFLANSYTKMIYGAYVQTEPQFFHAVGAAYTKKDVGTTSTYQVVRNWFMPFEQADKSYKIVRGLRWSYVAKLLEVPESAWKDLRNLEIDDHKFMLVSSELERANKEPDFQELDLSYEEEEREVDEWNPGEEEDDDDLSYLAFVRSHHGNDLTDEQIEEIASHE